MQTVEEFIKSNKLPSKSHQRFRIEKQNVFTEEVNKIGLLANYDKKNIHMHLVSKKKKIKIINIKNNITKQYKID